MEEASGVTAVAKPTELTAGMRPPAPAAHGGGLGESSSARREPPSLRGHAGLGLVVLEERWPVLGRHGLRAAKRSGISTALE